MTSARDTGASLLGIVGNALPDALVLVDTHGQLVEFNPKARRLLGLRPGAARLADYLASDATSRLRDYLRRCSGSRDPLLDGFRINDEHFRFEGMMVRRRDGDQPALVLVRITPRDRKTLEFRLLNDKIDELSREIVQRRRAESLIDVQRNSMELVAMSRALEPTLDGLVREAERQTAGRLKASILLLDETGTRLHCAAAPSLDAAYNAAIEGLEIGPTAGSCGTAAFRNEMVVVEDIETDPLWAEFRDLARKFELAACWSMPIRGIEGQVLGTFAMYYHQPGAPTDNELHVFNMVTRTASIAIERHHSDTRIAQLLERERALRERAEAASQAKNEFLALISHELRNPLHAMLGWTRILRMPEVDADTLQTGLETIERNAGLQSQLITDLLEFSRISTGNLRLKSQPVDIPSLVRKAADSLRTDCEGKDLNLTIDVDDDMPETMGDPDRLHQVICNLISNAVKFTPQGGQVRVHARHHDDSVTIQVEDTGEGISRAFLPHVFDRFRQSDGSPTRGHGGLGLGLAIVRYLVECHGGHVRAESEGTGKGACFTVTLPLSPQDTPVPETPTECAPSRLDGLHVLVVDDEPDACTLLDTALTRLGARITTAHSAQSGLKAARAQMPDCLVSDIAMPQADGYALLERFRALPGGAERPCVALTAYARESDRKRALESGFDAHLSKPLDPAELAEVIARLASPAQQHLDGERTAPHDGAS